MQFVPNQRVWQSSWTYYLAIAGLTVGLQLVWTLPALLARHSGSGFLLVYLAALVGFAGPMLAAEMWLGREGRDNPVHTVRRLQTRSGISRLWRTVGLLNMTVSILVLSYLVVIGGWALAFGLESANDVFLRQSPDYLIRHLEDFLSGSDQMVMWASVFLMITVVISSFGIVRGLGFSARLLMPFSLLILLVLLAHNVSVDAIASLLEKKRSLISTTISLESAWSAVALAFFSLSLGLGATMACSAYTPEGQRVGSAVFWVIIITLVFAVLVSLVVLPLLLHTNVEVAEGAPLLFLNLPLAFGASLHGDFYGALFYVLIAMISLSSAVMLLEPLVSYLQRTFFVPRYVAAIAAGGLVWLVAVVVGLSFNEWSDVRLLGHLSPFAVIEAATAYVLIPLTALLNCWLFVALFRSPLYSDQYSLTRRFAAKVQFTYAVPLLLAGLVWYSVQHKLLV